MKAEELQQVWRAQTPAPTQLIIDADLLLNEVRRNQRTLERQLFWRDVREIGVCVLLIPFWIIAGARLSMPITWYAMIPVLVWIGGFMSMERYRCWSSAPRTDQPLQQFVLAALAEVRHQQWLLRNVLWWYLLPFAIAVQIFLCELAWIGRSAGWQVALVIVVGGLLIQLVWVGGIVLVNRSAGRSELQPRERELERLLAELSDTSDSQSSTTTELPH